MLHDISKDTKKRYRLTAPGRQVFFLGGRSGAVTFELSAPGAEAYVFSLFSGRDAENQTLSVTMRHTAPRTRSRLLSKSVLRDDSSAHFSGLIRIERQAVGSDAAQVSRALTLGSGAASVSEPKLEILPDDVSCRHAATSGRPDSATLFYLESRGLTREEARETLADGFAEEVFDEIEKVADGKKTEKLRNQFQVTNFKF